MPGVRDLPADPLPARLSERRSMPGWSTSALSKVETDSALERPRTKDVRRVTSPFAARVPVNAAGGAYGNWARPGSSGDRASRGRSANVRLSGRWTVDRIRPAMAEFWDSALRRYAGVACSSVGPGGRSRSSQEHPRWGGRHTEGAQVPGGVRS